MLTPPKKSRGILSDIKFFFLQKPKTPTLIKFASEEEKKAYSHRIIQRIGIDVLKYSVQNIHRIGVKTPVRYVFEELCQWDGDSSCWPNHIATVERQDGQLEHIKIHLFNQKKYPFGFKKSFFGFKYIPLFSLNALKFQYLPGPSDDNARYLLYSSSGGYPIGIYAMYARSSIAIQKEEEQTQLFFAVGFNFYGRESGKRITVLNKIWEKVHNRVTSNVMNRFKQLCEWRFEKIQNGH